MRIWLGSCNYFAFISLKQAANKCVILVDFFPLPVSMKEKKKKGIEDVQDESHSLNLRKNNVKKAKWRAKWQRAPVLSKTIIPFLASVHSLLQLARALSGILQYRRNTQMSPYTSMLYSRSAVYNSALYKHKSCP